MASLPSCAPPHAPIRRPSAGIWSVPSLISSTCNYLPTLPHLRLQNKAKLVVKQRLSPIFASNTNPPEDSKVVEASDTSQGPPFLTILAGLVVFSGICWIIGSVVMWLVGLVFHPPPLK